MFLDEYAAGKAPGDNQAKIVSGIGAHLAMSIPPRIASHRWQERQAKLIC
jgi:hypothetical protein